MKTLMLFDQGEGDLRFYEFFGDLSELNGVYLQSGGGEDHRHLYLKALIYDCDFNLKSEGMKEPSKDYDVFIQCGIHL